MGRLTRDDRLENTRRRQDAGHDLARELALAEAEGRWGRLLTGVILENGRAVRNVVLDETESK